MKLVQILPIILFSDFRFCRIFGCDGSSNVMNHTPEQVYSLPYGLSDITLESFGQNVTFRRVKDYMISEHRIVAKKRAIVHSESETHVTLATQTSVENLHFLETLAEKWTGPISVAVFIDKEDVTNIRYIEYYYHCFPKIRANTTFHIVYPSTLELSYFMMDCNKFRKDLELHPFHKEMVKRMKYPYNVMRNMAIPRDSDGYIFFLDVDMVPSKNLHNEFLTFADKTNKSTLEASIFIVPAFESNDSKAIPDNKRDLIQALYKKDVQVFHIKTSQFLQFNTNYQKWRYTTTKSMSTYKITNKFYQYEPFYIMKRENFIPYDERFRGRGYDRISQVCEVWKAGYDFLVLSDVFVVHRGFHENKRPEKGRCIARSNAKNPRKQEKEAFWRLLFEIDQKRHTRRRILETLTDDGEEILKHDPNRALFWNFVGDLDQKYHTSGRLITQEWHLP